MFPPFIFSAIVSVVTTTTETQFTKIKMCVPLTNSNFSILNMHRHNQFSFLERSIWMEVGIHLWNFPEIFADGELKMFLPRGGGSQEPFLANSFFLLLPSSSFFPPNAKN